MDVFLRPEYRESKEKAQKVRAMLELTTLKDLVIKTQIYFDPDDKISDLPEDQGFLSAFHMFSATTAGAATAEDNNFSPWVLRM